MSNINIAELIKSTGKYFIKCLKRKRDILAKPEEIIRQLMLYNLIKEYGYAEKLLKVELAIHFGREKKYADILLFNKANGITPYCVFEIKKHKAKDGKEQLKSYCSGDILRAERFDGEYFLWKFFCYFINNYHKIYRFLPNFQISIYQILLLLSSPIFLCISVSFFLSSSLRTHNNMPLAVVITALFFLNLLLTPFVEPKRRVSFFNGYSSPVAVIPQTS